MKLSARLRQRSGFAWFFQREVGLILALCAAAALVLGFGLLAEEVLEGDTAAFDRDLLMLFRSGGDPAQPLGAPWVQELARDVTGLGSIGFLSFISVAVAVYLLLIGRRGMALFVVLSGLGALLASTLLKIGFDRPRPDIPHLTRVFTASFPSGHAMLSAVVFLTLGALLSRASTDRRVKTYFAALAVFLTVAVGVSRVYLGVHYPSDVLAGWCLGSAWALACWTAALWLKLDAVAPGEARR